MFNFFKRTKILPWEIELLKNIIKKLPKEYDYLFRQIDQNLFNGVLIGLSEIPGYVGFSFNPQVHDNFYDKNGRNYKLTGIKVFNKKSNSFLDVNIYIVFGMINGYSIEGKFDIDVNNIEINNFRKEMIDNSDFEKIANIFNDAELKVINPSEIYEVELNGISYYHIKDLEDGNFIGIDEKKNIYKIIHDPFKIIPVSENLLQLLN